MEHKRFADNARGVAAQWEAERLEEIRNLPDEEFDRLTIDQIQEEMSPEGRKRFLALVKERAVARHAVVVEPGSGPTHGNAASIPPHALPKAVALLVLVGLVAGAATGGVLVSMAAWDWAAVRVSRWWHATPSAPAAATSIPPPVPAAGPVPAPPVAPPRRPAPSPAPSARPAPAAPEAPSVLGIGTTARTIDLASAPSWSAPAASPRPLRANVAVDILRRDVDGDGEPWLYVRAGAYAAGIAGWLPADALTGVHWLGGK